MTSIGLSVDHEAAAGGSSLTQRAVGRLARLRTNWSRYLAARRAEKQLAALDDRMLDDIGLGRDEIPQAVRDARLRPIPYWSR